MLILDCKQGSEEWLAARRGIPTASCLNKLITSKGVTSSQWKSYLDELIAEYIDPSESPSISTADMENGREMEPKSRRAYELETGYQVTEVGGIWLDEKHSALCSPDGLILDHQKGVEYKCPKLKNHIKTIRDDKVPSQYVIQVQSGMLFSEYETWDFVSYHPAYLPCPLWIKTVHRDEVLIRKIRDSINHLNMLLDQEKAKIDSFANVGF